MLAGDRRHVGQDGNPGRRKVAAGQPVGQRRPPEHQRHDRIPIPNLPRYPLAQGIPLERVDGLERRVQVARLDGAQIRPSGPLRSAQA